MNSVTVQVKNLNNKLLLRFSGELNLYTLPHIEEQLQVIEFSCNVPVEIDFLDVESIDTAAALFFENFEYKYTKKKLNISYLISKQDIRATLDLVKNNVASKQKPIEAQKDDFFYSFGKSIYQYYLGLLSFFNFLGNIFATKFYYLKSVKNIRFKEIAFEINESGIKALAIIATTSFLIGLVVAYQSAYQLKIYGANIFLVDMLGISLLRELAPMITAIVIAGRSGSAFTAQIGAMKITEELDAMRTMGFDPYIFLVIPRILALMIVMPLLVFVADIMGLIGGMIVANVDLSISPTLFLERFLSVVDIRHFFLGILKAPFFAFLIASIAIYRGLRVKDDTQSIGFNTTKSVVESIFAVIVCDAAFSVVFTNMGI